MSRLPQYANLITRNDVPIIVVFQTEPYAHLVMSNLRTEDFEKTFKVEMSEKTHALEEQYEEEYKWEIKQIQYVKSQDAIKMAHKAMNEAFPDEED